VRGGPGQERAADAVKGANQSIGGEAVANPPELILRNGKGRRTSWSPPAGRLRRRPQLRLLGRRVAQEQGEQLPAAALALALLLSLGLGVALDRVGGELVDVGEDRLGEQAELLGVSTLAPGGGRDPAPGDSRAHPVRRLQRVERPSLTQLAAAEPYIYVAAGVPAGLRIADQGDELPQRLAHAGADPDPEVALQGAGVLGHLLGDRRQDLLGRRGQLRLDRVGDLGRQALPGLACA
jgi:hypothetical protein